MASVIFKPFASVDLETSGLVKDTPYIFEIGAHFEDYGYFNKMPEEEKVFNVKIQNGKLDPSRCGEVAMDINKNLLRMIEDGDESDGAKIVTLDEAKHLLREWLQKKLELVRNEKILCYNPDRYLLTPAGKNFGGFDAVIFNQNNFGLDDILRHRVLDPGSMYAKYFGDVPSLDQILKMLGQPVVTHRALDDARDVSYVIVKELSQYMD